MNHPTIVSQQQREAADSDHQHIEIRGARQHTLKDLSLDIPLNALTVVTGVSGSGKSTLAFDTLFAEGQRRYIETFSPYVRQFLAQMDRPDVDAIEGVPPAVAIEQYNPVRTSRSTVGTMTEINDYLKLLFARHSQLVCPDCKILVNDGNTDTIVDELIEQADSASEPLRVEIQFALPRPDNVTEETLHDLLSSQGYTRFSLGDEAIQITQDRLRVSAENRPRLVEAIEHALSQGAGQIDIAPINKDKSLGKIQHYQLGLNCSSCQRHFTAPTPNAFSFNAPSGACEECKGFGRVIGIDYELVIPDERLSIEDGAIKPWQTPSNAKFQRELVNAASKAGIPTDVAWGSLSMAEKNWVILGDTSPGGRKKDKWWGVKAFFDYWERKSYKMHVRVQLAKYRSYRECPACHGARLKPESLYWHLPVSPDDIHHNRHQHGLNFLDIHALPIEEVTPIFNQLSDQSTSKSAQQLFDEINRRLAYLHDVGLGYLTLDRQTRTLSGGEVQRINLTTALGSSLTHTLFVLDEPTVGLHAEEVERIIKIMLKLRDAGNTLLVVEHDPEVMLAADHVIDMGPGAGALGGEIQFQGDVEDLLHTDSPTGRFLSKKDRIPTLNWSEETAEPTYQTQVPTLQLQGIHLHNLTGLNISIPIQGMTVVAGVSGSGKSTLVTDVLYPAYQRWKGERIEFHASVESTDGFEAIEDMVLVDQSPIGKSTRSNPISYVGAYDGIRQLFAKTPESIEQNLTASTFSFNSGKGRCATCQGNGFELVEMQFMSDVYLRCQDCNGKRFQPETLAIQYYSPTTQKRYNIHDVLSLTVAEALEVFADQPKIQRALAPLQAVGLQYLPLGQPVPTLSGGEAQRLKLAKFLVNKNKQTNKKSKTARKPTLFIFDEPTTGLHLSDVATLLKALQELVTAGDALLIVEHHVDVINSAQQLIELGPGAGKSGGQIIFTGSPHMARQQDTATGRALKANETTVIRETAAHYQRESAPKQIQVIQAREHNLKNISVEVPHNQLVAVTGVSGSGKSTLAFNILFAEGQRRYLESLNAFSRQFIQPPPRPEVDGLLGMPPAIAIEQRTSRGGRKSTVATTTEIYHYLRQIYLLLGQPHCPTCHVEIRAQTSEQIDQQIRQNHSAQNVMILAPLVIQRKGLYKDLAAWAASNDFDQLMVNGKLESTDNWPKLDRNKLHDIDLVIADTQVPKHANQTWLAALDKAIELGKGQVKLSPLENNPTAQLFSTEYACPSCQRSFEAPDPRLFSYNSSHGWCPSCEGNGVLTDESVTDETAESVCTSCDGMRLNPYALGVNFRDLSIGQISQMSIDALSKWLEKLTLNERELRIIGTLKAEIQSRLAFLQEVGLNYLSLDRSANTLSGGEAQRIRLAAQMGANMSGACYVMDEPTIGLHARDNQRLISAMRQLVNQGNSVIVVEHDEATIRAADHIIDIGPGAGVRGGQVMSSGSLPALLAKNDSLTSQQLNQSAERKSNATELYSSRTTKQSDTMLSLKGVTLHNLKALDLHLPLQRFVSVAGVSGGGKSSLIRSVLEPNLRHLIQQKHAEGPPLTHASSIENAGEIGRVLEVDQTPIGRTSRSTPATYIGIWDDIRKQLANTQEARLRGWKIGRFSFNTKAGCCAECDGQGEIKIEMNFLPDVREPCQRCRGMRFNQETLQVKIRGKSAGDILNMPVDEAVDFFESQPKTHHALALLQAVGLGYLTLGQPSSTLSGGEAQRIKLVTELAKAKSRSSAGAPHTLYILDEPTVGLHMADVEKLVTVLHQLVEEGHSVVVIEHNTDLIKASDWLIELGPEGGDAGGKIIATGMPKALIKGKKQTPTLSALRDDL